MSQSLSEEAEQKIINEEYKTWKKNSAFLYDIILSSALEWPSLTCEWLPDKKAVKDDVVSYSVERMILGTHTNDTELNHLLICEVKIPSTDIVDLQNKYSDSSDLYGGYGGSCGKIEIIQRMIHDGEVNRARYMPQNSDIICTKTKYSSIHIFDRRKHLSKPNGNVSQPNLILTGHDKEGYGIDWNKFSQGLLLSGSDDAKICMWDINKYTRNNNDKKQNGLNAHYTFVSHDDRVEDVAWHQKQEKIFASVSDDKTLKIWDYTAHSRGGSSNNNSSSSSSSSSNNSNISSKAQHTVKDAHKGEINCVSFSPFNENLLLTGGVDKIVALWDMRNLSQKLHSLEGHTSQIYQVEWSPHSEVHLGSCGADRRVMIWDLSLIGTEQAPEDAEDGPPELIFIHGGHTDKVSDFSWNKNSPWLISSVADNNIVQCWQMTDELLTYDDLTKNAPLE